MTTPKVTLIYHRHHFLDLLFLLEIACYLLITLVARPLSVRVLPMKTLWTLKQLILLPPGFRPGPTAPTGLPVNKVAVIMQPPVTNTNSLDFSIHAQPLPAPSTVASQGDKGKSVAFDIPECQPSPDGNAAAIKSTPSRFHAAAYLRDAPDAFKVKFTTNRSMCDEVDCSLSCYSSYGARIRCDGSGDNKKILVFFNNQDDFTDCVNSPRSNLLDLAFTHYSPTDVKLSNEAKSLFVTDIPLFLNKTQVCQAFSRYGTVIKCKLTPRKHYYNGHIQFSSADAVTQFNDIWAIICLGNFLRVCPASFSKSQRDSHREHVAILAGIPKNIEEADLLEIATQVNTKALNIPYLSALTSLNLCVFEFLLVRYS
ncbi:hypothetical protein RhiirA1_447155 [Rhizophagus irregularis]|uniref:RRM domain-containing protein n=1 Tax=Rhizophagus irregularis TaxID=588596 RepID=A0A2N0QSN5_9GLOM|nr:hypothetical protein RhiirA1_447155 [Rhizophagus irregularis]